MPKKQHPTPKPTQNKSKHISKQGKQSQNHEQKHKINQTSIAKTNPNIAESKKSKDKRFAAAEYDPKFKTPSANIGKVQIDQRFAEKLQSQKFRIAGTVDKYGRKQVQTQNMGDMSDYYYTQENAKQKDKGVKNGQVKTASKEKPKSKIVEEEPESEQSSQEGQNRISRWMQDYNQQSSSEQENAGDEAQGGDYMSEEDDVWSEQDEDVIKGEHVLATKRLALCNYDWMNITAKDLLLLFSSFKTSTGTVLAVRVYYSQIGKEKMEQENKYGPQGIWSSKSNKPQQSDKFAKSKSKRAEEQAFNQSKLRQYEKQRLKYCYAIIECNSPKTADQIYRECDGNQFENSNILFDLRFVPDDTKFDKQMLKQKCEQLPTKGEVKNFISRALGHSHVGLTWEDPQLNSTAGLKKKNWNKMTDKQMDNIDWGLYMNEDGQHADENYNKIINKNKAGKADVQDESQSQAKVENMSDWRREANKKYKSKDDDIEISFPSGFESQITAKSDKLSLKKQVKTKKQRWRQQRQQKEQRRRQQMQLLVQKQKGSQFKYNPEDERFKAVLNNPSYYIDPSNPKFDHRKVGAVFEHIVKQNRKKNLE